MTWRFRDILGLPDPGGARRQRLAEIEADREYRAHRLNRKDTEYWTQAVIAAAAEVRRLPPTRRPCAYRNWLGVLNEYSREPPFTGDPPSYRTSLPGRLMQFTADVAQPAWPEPLPHLVEFAFAFLEADVMLHRSGYAKRHLIKRLKAVPLDKAQIKRMENLLRRAVEKGASVEEFRAYRKIAAHLVARGELTEFRGWLEQMAAGTIIPYAFLDWPHLWDKFDARSFKKQGGIWRFYPDEPSAELPPKKQDETSQKAGLGAFWMLRQIARHEGNRTLG